MLETKMKSIQQMKLPIKKIELFDVDKMAIWFKNEEIILSKNNMDLYRIFWTRKPTEEEIKKLKKIL